MVKREQQHQSKTHIKNILRALDHRNTRLYFTGQALSLIGTWMTRIASAWLIYRLTDSAYLLGILGFAGQIPTFLISPLAGVWIDRWDRQKLLIVTQIFALIQSFLLALVSYLALPAMTTYTLILVLSIFQGIINAIDTPARQSFLFDIVVKRENLPNAIALNSSLVHLARLVGPAIAGFLIALWGETSCFLIDGFSYCAVIAALFGIRGRRVAKPSSQQSGLWHGLREGMNYAFGFVPIRALLCLIALMALMGMPYTILMPVMAKDVLGGDATTLGLLNALSGGGALVGAIYLASRSSVLGLGRIIAMGSFLFSGGLILFSLSKNLWFSCFLLFWVGFGFIVQLAAGNTIIQTLVEDHKRGRVMSLYTTAFLGMTPFGSLFAGMIAKWIGTPLTLLIGGIGCLIGSTIFYLILPKLRRLTRPIYIEKGIIKDLAAE